MLLTVAAVVLFGLWILGFAVFHVGGSLIHLLLVLAVIALVWQRRTALDNSSWIGRRARKSG
jgi:hypothetical protein